MADDSSRLNQVFAETSFLYGANAVFIEMMQERWAQDPNSVPPEWRAFFDQLLDRPENVKANAEAGAWANPGAEIRDDLISAMDGFWPAVQAGWYSFQLQDAFGERTQFVGMANFAALFKDSNYLHSFRITALFSELVAGSGIAISLLLAAMADRVIRGALAYKTLLIWPYAVAPAVAGVLWLFLFAPSIGIVTFALRALGEAIWGRDQWVSDEEWTWSVLDPVITVHPDRIFFEAFSGDQSAYAALFLDPGLFATDGDVRTGTTNVDFNEPMRAGLARVRDGMDLIQVDSLDQVLAAALLPKGQSGPMPVQVA